MVKRFTETTKWVDPWFMDLPVKYKAFWFYICDQCDVAGVWEPNMRLAVAQIGEPMELVEILRVFEKRIEQTKDGKLWIRKFIQFQQGTELNLNNAAHRGVIKRLDINNLESPIPVKPQTSPSIAPAKLQPRGYGGPSKGLTSFTGKGKGKGKSLPFPLPEKEKVQKEKVSSSHTPPQEPSKEEIAHRKAIASQHIKELRDKLRFPPIPPLPPPIPPP
jgi:hypothetical protein